MVGAPGTAATLTDALKAAGAAKIYAAESDDADQFLVTPKVDVLVALVESAAPAAVLVASTAEGKEVAGRLAAATGLGVLWDVVGVKEGGSRRALRLRRCVHRRGQGRR